MSFHISHGFITTELARNSNLLMTKDIAEKSDSAALPHSLGQPLSVKTLPVDSNVAIDGGQGYRAHSELTTLDEVFHWLL